MSKKGKFDGIDDQELAAEVARRLKHHGRKRTAQKRELDSYKAVCLDRARVWVTSDGRVYQRA